MRSRGVSRLLSFLAVASVMVLAGPDTAFSAPPPNDFFADAILTSPLPFTHSEDVGQAGLEPGEFVFLNCAPFTMQGTVWYRLPASSAQAFTVNVNGSDPGVFVNVYVDFGGGINSLGFVSCTSPIFAPAQFTTQPGGTYYIQAGSYVPGPANLVLNVAQVPPPPNDNFAAAKTIDVHPYLDPVDLTAATTEPGEPTPSQAFTTPAASAWYKFTPDVTESLQASVESCCTPSILAVYTGTLGNFLEIRSRSFGFPTQVPFQALAGTTYYIQVARGPISGGTTPMTFRLDVAPPPVAQFFTFTPDPSTFDTIQFQDTSFDPAGIGIATQEWDFGDGTGGTGQFPTHQYAVDGDYTVGLTVTTHDGRTASTTQPLRVRTRDVAITKFTVPNSAKAGQTRELTAGVRNSHSPENVQFQLFKSVPGFGGFQLVGTLTQLVPVTQGNKTVPVTMSYTFSKDDAAVGKVTFQIVAQMLSGRDALPADNTAIAPPTRVNP